MKSPFTNKEMELKHERRSISFRKDKFEILYHFYYCNDYEEEITNPSLEEINLNQVYNQYRSKYHLPFPDEIQEIRKKYNLTAPRMSLLLGFGINMYKNYENGEVPSESNAKLIQLAKDPLSFKSIIKLNYDESDSHNHKLLKKIDELIYENEKKQRSQFIEQYIFGESQPNEFSGFKSPSLDVMTEMVVFFTEKLQPYKSRLNKMLFYADFLQYKKSCYSISGAKYHEIKQIGPVPDNSNTLFEFISNNKDVEIIFDKIEPGLCERFIPRRSFNEKLFNPSQLETLYIVANNFEKLESVTTFHNRYFEATINSSETINEELHLSYNLGFDLINVIDNDKTSNPA